MILLHKNIEHHIERHYDIESNKNNYLQQIIMTDSFYLEKLKHCLNIYDSTLFFNDLWEEYSVHDTLDSFDFINSSSFYNFFSVNRVDIPKCFKNTFSVKRSVNEIMFLKFNNYLMRDGGRYKSFKFFVNFLWKFFEDLKTLSVKPYKSYSNWRDIFITLNSLSFSNPNYLTIDLNNDESLTYGHKFTGTSKEIQSDWNIRNFFNKNLQSLMPMFSFYIYKVDKKIFKNTRGKSGKYTFIWKYVSPYKRLFLVMHWIMKELRLKPGRTLEDRLYLTLNTLLLSPNKTWIYKVKKFSYNYVYRNSRRTLAETYRTVTK